MTKKRNTTRWVRLDNAAKIYPAARRRNWSNVYRQSVTLKEEVDTDILKAAVEVTVKRFPSIAARLRKGIFWFYLQQVDKAPEIKEEQSYPLCFMSDEEMRKCAFRVIVYHERIAVEFFHSLTDGTGALVFLKNLVAEYLERRHKIKIPSEFGVLDRNVPPRAEELRDCFPENAGAAAASRREATAWHMSGEVQKDGFLNLTCFRVPVQDSLALAHKYNVTLTVFYTAVMMMALQNLQEEKVSAPKKRQRIKVLIPINLRKLFPSETLRNFAMYTSPELDTRLGRYSFREICDVIVHRMGLDFTKKHMSSVIAKNVGDEKNPLVRLIPLPIKNLVMKAIFDTVGERKSCLTLSNLGKIELPEIMYQYIERMDFILGVQASAPYNCGMLTYGDTVYINFIRNIRDAELERHFYLVLRDMELPVTVESNRNGR